MLNGFDVETWRQILIEWLTQLGGTIATFVPSLLGTLVILAVGWLVSYTAESVASRALRRFGLDEGARRARVDQVLLRAGIEMPPSRIAARLLFWALMLTFLLSAVEALGLTAVTKTIDRLIAFLPRIVASGLILVIGFVLARFGGTVASSAAAAANIDQATRLGALVRGTLIAVVAVLALEQLGVDTSVLITVLSVVLGAVSLSVGIAFALGARPVISHILAGHFIRQSLTVGESIEIDGHRGTVERVGAVDTMLSDGDSRWSVPNSQVLDAVVVRPAV